MIERIKTEYFLTQGDYTFNIIRSELQILIAKLARNKNKQNPIKTTSKYLNEFIQFQTLVEKNVTQNAKVSYYAKEMGFSTKTLNTITQHTLSKSAKSFIDEIYIKQIKRLLLNTQHPIKEIAYQTGFEETTNLYKYFKKHIQLTPELAMSEGEWNGKKQSFYDLYRIENGKIVEHWDVIQEIPEKMAHENRMF